jgi:hypothetical protein
VLYSSPLSSSFWGRPADSLWTHFCDAPSLGSFIINGLYLLLSSQYLELNGQLYKLDIGLLTGLTCASTLANIYLSLFDEHLVHSVPNLCKLYRYIDDGLMILHGPPSSHNTSAILAACNTWHPTIAVPPKASSIGLQVNFLDLLLDASGTRFEYQTYRKPLNNYDYVPGSSEHRRSTFDGIVHTEMHRLLYTNSSGASFARHKAFFLRRFCMRGHLRSRAHVIASKYTFALKALHLKPKQRLFRHVKVPMRPCSKLSTHMLICHHHVVHSRVVKKVMAKYSHLFGSLLGDTQSVHLDVAHTVNRNLFRLVHNAAW